MLTRGVVASYVSFDDGRSWCSNGPLPLPAGFDGGGDLSAGFDGDGRAFVCGLLTEPAVSQQQGHWAQRPRLAQQGRRAQLRSVGGRVGNRRA